MSGASVPGTSHVREGRGGDDAFAYALAPDGRGLVIAVADGAGSRSGTSALGSFAACRAIVSSASPLLVAATSEATAEPAVRDSFAAALTAVGSFATDHGLRSGDLATTLAVAVVTPYSAVVAQVGDGIIVCDIDGKAEALVPEEKGEYANETVFITTRGALEEQLRVRFIDATVTRVALSTDGLRYMSLQLQDGGIPYEPFYDSVWRAAADDALSPEALTTWLTKVDDQTGDDLTLVVGALVEAPFGTSAMPAALASPMPPEPVSSQPAPGPAS